MLLVDVRQPAVPHAAQQLLQAVLHLAALRGELGLVAQGLQGEGQAGQQRGEWVSGEEISAGSASHGQQCNLLWGLDVW